MEKMLQLQFVIFGLILVGLFTRRKGMISREGQKSITKLVINIVLPCNIFNSFIQEFSGDMLRDCAAVFLISLGIQAFCVVYGRFAYPRETEEHRKCLAYGVICSNAGFLGNPIAEGLYGATGLMLASVYLIPVRVMMWSAGLAIFSGSTDKKATLKKVITHPCVIACLLGLAFFVTQTGLPAPVLSIVQTLGRCNTALSMMVIGMILSDIDLAHMANAVILRYTVERLVAIPLLVWGVMALLGRAGLVSGIGPNLCVLLAAMPAGATTSMLASQYECGEEFATSMVIFSTLCSIPTLFLWTLVLG